MTDIPKQRGQEISPGLEIRNHTDAEILVAQIYGEIRINLAQVKLPVIVTVSRGRSPDGARKA